MLVFIHDNFTLNLTNLNVTFSEINQWMKDDISNEFSIPFEIILDSELIKKTGFENHYNANKNTMIYPGILDSDGVLNQAFFKIQTIKGKKLTAVINSGTDNYSSFDKQLTELDLENKPVVDIVADAIEVIAKGYPETNYNFPMIHTDKYDSDSDEWNGFGKIINNYAEGQFLSNELDVENDIDVIKNIMQPLPYLLHILKTGVAASGKILAGDILEDQDLIRALVWRDGDYYDKASKEEIQITYKNNEYDRLSHQANGIQYVIFEKEVVISKKGDYILSGNISSLLYTSRKDPAKLNKRKRLSTLSIVIDKITVGSTTRLNSRGYGSQTNSGQNLREEISQNTFEIPVTFEAGDKLKITKIEPLRSQKPSPTPDYPEAISLYLTPVRYQNSDGSPILSVLNKTEIDLKKVVPDMTFRTLVSVIKNWFNYEFIPNGDFIYMNKIENKLDRSTAINLSDFDIEEPERQLSEDIEYELAFSDGKSNADYKYDSVLVNKSGFTINNYYTKDTTKTIKIDGLPLPVITRSGVLTAYSFENETSKLRLVFMKPMPVDQSPVAFNNLSVLMPAIYQNRYVNWLNFRIFSVAWNWEFLISVEKLKEITIQSIIYAYQNYHVLTQIEKERLNNMYWRVNAKTESLV